MPAFRSATSSVGWVTDGASLVQPWRTSARSPRSGPLATPPQRGHEAEAAEYFTTYVWYPQRAGRSDLVVERARARGVGAAPVVRQEITRLLSFVRANEWTAARAKAAPSLGRAPGPEGSLGKLAVSEVARRAARVHTLIAGASGMLSVGPDPSDAIIAEVLVSTPAQSIAGGTDEIQRNIIGEKTLGLPREPATDTDGLWRDSARG